MKAVNLIPSDQRRAAPSGALAGGSYAVLGVLAVLLVMAVAYVLASNAANERQSKADAAKQEADSLSAQTKQLGAFTDFSAIKEQRLVSVMGAAQSRFDWERLMRELSRVIPENSWVQTTDAKVVGNSDGTDPTSTTTSSTAAVAGPSANLVGCTPHQSDTARMMVRLEQMYRVTDVELNESAREQGATDTTLDNCGRMYKFDLTVNFSPTPPATEAPEGEVRVPASLGGGS
jgi:Tfp pilus assembly protein PilN